MVEEAGLETDGMAETTSQLQAKLKALTDGKVDIMVDANNFKNTTEILREMSKEWERMTDVEQAAALELLGGKRQANTLSAIISNFDIVEDAIEASMNSEGSAMEENEKVLQSIEGRITLFNNSIERFWNNLLDDEVIKMFVDLGRVIVETASKFGELRSVIFAILMYFNLSKKYPFDLASMIFGPNGIGGLLSGLKRVKKEAQATQELLGLPAPKTLLGLPAPQTGLVPTGPRDLTTTSSTSGALVTTPIMPEEDSTSFFTNMINNARMAAQNIWQLFMNMINKLKTAASNIFTGAFNTIKTKVGNFTNQIKKTYYKATNQAFMTDESGKVHKAEVIDRRMSVYDGIKSDAKTASKVSQMWQNHMGRLRDSIGRVKQDFSTVWKHHNERVAQSVKYASAQFNKLKTSANGVFGKISAVTSNVANAMKMTYGKAIDVMKSKTMAIQNAFVMATSKAYVTDESGKVHRAEILPTTRPTVYKQPEQSYSKVNEAINKIKLNLHNTVESGKWMFEDLALRVRNQFNKIRTNVGGAIGGTFNNIKTTVEAGFNKTVSSVSSAINKIKSKFGRQASTGLVPTTSDGGAQQAYSGFAATARKVSAEVNRIWQQHIVNLRTSFGALKSDISTIWQHHKIRVADSVAHAKSQFSGMVNGISTQFGKIKTGVSNVFGGFAKFAQDTSTKVKTIFGKMTAPIVDKFNKMSNGIKSAFNKIKTAANDTANATTSAFKSKLGYNDADINVPSWLSVGSSLTANDLVIPENAAEEIDKINLAMQQGEVALNNQMSAYGGTNKALQAYIASLNGGKASMAGFKAFCDAQNISLKATGTSALIAKVGVMALQTALSLGLSLVIQLVVEGLMKLVQYLKDIVNPAEKLKEELSDLQTELSDIKSELDSVDTELEKVHERMEELLALPSLSFVEQEELEKLQQTAATLGRTKKALTAEETRAQQRTAEKAKETVDSQLEDTSWDGDALSVIEKAGIRGLEGMAMGAMIGSAVPVVGTVVGALVGAAAGLITGIVEDFAVNRISTEDKLNREIGEYDDLIKKRDELQDKLATADQTKGKFLWWETDSEYDKVKKELDKVETEIKETEEYIDTTLGEIGTSLEGVEYGQGADDALDIYNKFKNRWEITYGSDGAKATAIDSVISKDKYSDLSNQIDAYVKKLKDGDESATKSIESLINGNTDFVNELKANGVELQDALDYFTLEKGIFDSDTVKGIALQYDKGKKVMQQFAESATASRKALGEAALTDDELERMKKLQMGGNVDLFSRPRIDSANLVENGWTDAGDGISTVYTNTYTNESGTIYANFTPILPNGQVLSPDELQAYAEGVIAGTREDDLKLQIGSEFSSEEAAEAAAIEIHELQEKYYKDPVTSEITFEVDGETKKVNFDDLFEEGEDGKFTAKKEEFSEMLKGMDEEARTTFISLAEKVKNGALTWNQAMDAFDAYGMVAALEVVNSQIADINSEMFSDVADELSGLIDTFGELSSVLESTAASMDLLKTAQDQYNSSGRVSVKTALELMQSTDNWNELLKIEDGNIRLVNNAEELLIQSKLDHIKVNLQNALSTVKAQIAAVEATGTSANFATTLDESTNIAVQELSKSMITLVELMKAYKNGTSTEDAMAAADEQIARLDERLNAYKGPAVTKEESLSNLYKQQANLEAMLEMYEGIDTTSEYKNNYDFDKTPGDKYKDDTAADAFDDTMAYWENRIAAKQSQSDQIQNEIDSLEAQGKKAAPEYYKGQIALEEDKIDLLEEQKEDALEYLNSVEEGSDEWWEAAKIVNDIEQDIDDATENIQSWNDAIADVNWYGIEEPLTRFDNHTDTLENMRELIAPNGEDDWFDDEGNWTEKGVAVAGTYVQEIGMDEASLANTREVLDKLNKPYEGNEEYYKGLDLGIDSEQDLYNKREEYQKKEQGYVKKISDNKQNLVDMYDVQIDKVEEWADSAVEAYQDYIDVVQEALDAERDLYEFKNKIKDQTEDIAELERRIASLSGSDNAADIAERRKLEAELYDKREDLNDSYYDHAKDAQNDALQDEADAYEEAMNNFIANLRESLEIATEDMNSFMSMVYNAVISNAPAIKKEYEKLGISLDSAIIDPWTAASEAIKGYQDGDGEKLGLNAMNDWIKEGGIFPTFKTDATDALKSPWEAGSGAVKAFKTDVDEQMNAVVSKVKSNVEKAKGDLADLYSGIKDTPNMPSSVTGGGGGGGNTDGEGLKSTEATKTLQKFLNQYWNTAIYDATGATQLAVDGKYGDNTTKVVKEVQKRLGMKSSAQDGKWGANTIAAMRTYYSNQMRRMKDYPSSVAEYQKRHNAIPNPVSYAKGTIGTKHDEFAITDESWIGEEITLAAGKNGQLQYLKKGSAVMPADISANLVEWGKINPDMMKVGGGANLNMISNAVNKPEFNMSFDSLVHVDHCDEGTLKDLEKMVDVKINQFSKQMNYAIKKIGGR